MLKFRLLGSNPASARPEAAPAPPKTRRSWKRRLAGPALLLLLVAVFLPNIACWLGLHHVAARRLSASIDGTVRVQGMSASWVTAPTLTGVELLDRAGNPVLSADKVRPSRSLFGLVFGGDDMGEIVIDKAKLSLRPDEAGSNLERLLAPLLNKPKSAPTGPVGPQKPPKVIVLRLQNSKVLLQDGTTEVALDAIEAAVTIGKSSVPEVVLSGKTGPNAGQTLGLELRPRPDGGVAFKLLAKDLPLAFVKLGLVRADPQADLSGTAEIDLDGGSSPGGESAELEGRIALSRLELALPSALADRVRLTSVVVPVRLRKSGSVVDIREVSATADVGSVLASGRLDLDRMGGTELLQGLGEIKGDLDLAKLARLMPKTLAIREGLTLDRGTVRFEATPSAGGDGRRVWSARFSTTELAGSHDGKAVAWREPLTLEAVAAIDAAGSIDLRRFLAHADFAHAELTPDGDRVKGEARADLNQLAARLGQFIDLGGVGLKGTMTAGFLLAPRPDGLKQLTAQAEFKGFELALTPGRVWKDESLTAKANAILKPMGTGANYSIEGAAFSAQAGADWAWAQLAGPVRDWQKPQFDANVRIAGELAHWRDRAAAVSSSIDKVKLQGAGELSGRLRVGDEPAVKLDDAKLLYQNFRFQGYGLTIDEPTLSVNTSMNYNTATSRLELGSTAVRCSTLTGTAERLALDLGDKIRVGGQMQVEANLERVEKWYAPAATANDLHGHFSGKVGGDESAPRLTLTLDGRVVGAKYGPAKAPFWQEQELKLSARAAMDDTLDNLTVESFSLSGHGVSANAKGALTELSKGMFLKLDGTLNYDLVKLKPQYGRYLGASATLEGVESRPFHLSGPLGTVPGATSKSTLQLLTADGGLGWARAEAVGAEIGKASAVVKLRDGVAAFDPIKTTINGGKFTAEPKLEFRPDGEVVVTLKPGDGIDRAKITPKMCASALGFAAPTIAGVAQADGEVSFVFDAAEIPTGDVSKAKVAARMTLHAAKVAGSPMVEEICQILKTPPQLAIVKEAIIPIVVADGRVHHKDLELVFPDFSIKTAGWVAFDGTMSIVAEVPIPAKLLVKTPLKGNDKPVMVRLPITGTVNRPRIDPKEMSKVMAELAKTAGTEKIRDEIEKRLGGQLDKILQPKPEKK